MEQAIAAFLGQSRRAPVVAAGRTDAGVHATGQVVHVDVVPQRPSNAWVRGLNAYLPKDIAVRWAQEVSDDFHARFSANARAYRYSIYNHPVRAPLSQRYSAWCFRPLDDQAMLRASRVLLGRHDFSSFRSSQCQAKTAVRTVKRLDIVRRGHFVEIEIEADAFLHHMVRNIVGSLVYVGLGRESEAWLAQVLAACDRTCAAPTYAAGGLTLIKVTYPETLGIPE